MGLEVASAQLQNASRDKIANLSTTRSLTGEAAARRYNVVAFGDCRITGYTFASHLSRAELLTIAEPMPTRPSVQEPIAVAASHSIVILAGRL